MHPTILVASDGSGGSSGALRWAIGYAKTHDCGLEVLTVCPPLPAYTLPEAPPMPEGYPLLQGKGAEELRSRVIEQVREIDAGRDWPVTSRVGSPPVAIAAYAQEIGATTILVGTGPRLAAERWLRSDTAPRIVHLAQVPVLLVPPDATALPLTALVAVDFSDFSLAAARAALPFIRQGGKVHLVHVVWSPDEAEALPSLTEYWETYRRGAEVRLEELATELRGSSGLPIGTSVVIGDPMEEILALSVRLEAELIAAGTHGYGFVGRIVMGSVSSRLIRGARTAVLLVPPATSPGLPEDASAARAAATTR